MRHETKLWSNQKQISKQSSSVRHTQNITHTYLTEFSNQIVFSLEFYLFDWRPSLLKDSVEFRTMKTIENWQIGRPLLTCRHWRISNPPSCSELGNWMNLHNTINIFISESLKRNFLQYKSARLWNNQIFLFFKFKFHTTWRLTRGVSNQIPRQWQTPFHYTACYTKLFALRRVIFAPKTFIKSVQNYTLCGMKVYVLSKHRHLKTLILLRLFHIKLYLPSIDR